MSSVFALQFSSKPSTSSAPGEHRRPSRIPLLGAIYGYGGNADDEGEDQELPAYPNPTSSPTNSYSSLSSFFTRTRRAKGRITSLARLLCIAFSIFSISFISISVYKLLLSPYSIHVTSSGDSLLPTFSVNSLSGLVNKCNCGVPGSEFCEKYGPQTMLRSRIYEGTNTRVDRLLAKAKRGERLLLSLMGGSVSACHGVNKDPMGDGCYPKRIHEWFNDQFPVPGGHLFKNGAIGGMDSSYYAFCGINHVPTNADLVILEFDVNDQPTEEFSVYFDQLLRIVLDLPNQPAVVVLGMWGPVIGKDLGFLDPQHVHIPVAMYYDVPYISIKQLIWHHYIRFPHSTFNTFWAPDWLHPNVRGHRILADMVTSYFSTRLCLLETFGIPSFDWNPRGGLPPDTPADTPAEDSNGFDTLSSAETFSDTITFQNVSHHRDDAEEEEEHGPIIDPSEITTDIYHFLTLDSPLSLPPLVIRKPLVEVFSPMNPDLSKEAFEQSKVGEMVRGIGEPKPFCADSNDPDHPLDPRKYEGWRKYVWHDEKHFWVSDTVGARIVVDITSNEGRVAVFYFRSETLTPGVAWCWVDDNYKGRYKLEGHWGWKTNIPAVAYIDQDLYPGKHYVSCEIGPETANPEAESPHHFRIVAIMAT